MTRQGFALGCQFSSVGWLSQLSWHCFQLSCQSLQSAWLSSGAVAAASILQGLQRLAAPVLVVRGSLLSLVVSSIRRSDVTFSNVTG